MFHLLLYHKYRKDCLTQRRHLINICWLNTQSKCVAGQNQSPWSRSPPSETHFENSEWRKISTKEFLNPKWFHSAYFKDPSNDAHQAITAPQIAFFSTQFTYKRLGNEAILEISHLGERRRMAPVSIWSNYLPHSQGERRQCNEEALGLEGSPLAFSLLALRAWVPGARDSPSASALSPRLSWTACHSAEGTGEPIHLLVTPPWNARCSISARVGHLRRAKFPLIYLC